MTAAPQSPTPKGGATAAGKTAAAADRYEARHERFGLNGDAANAKNDKGAAADPQPSAAGETKTPNNPASAAPTPPAAGDSNAGGQFTVAQANSGAAQTPPSPPTPASQTDAQAPSPRATPTAAVAQEILRRTDGQSTHFQVRLDPPELGRVTVRIQVGRDKRVTASVSAENPAALSDLMRNARELQRALTDSGLQLDDSGLSFDLADQGAQGQDWTEQDMSGQAAAARRAFSSPIANHPDTNPLPTRSTLRMQMSSGGVDVWA